MYQVLGALQEISAASTEPLAQPFAEHVRNLQSLGNHLANTEHQNNPVCWQTLANAFLTLMPRHFAKRWGDLCDSFPSDGSLPSDLPEEARNLCFEKCASVRQEASLLRLGVASWCH